MATVALRAFSLSDPADAVRYVLSLGGLGPHDVAPALVQMHSRDRWRWLIDCLESWSDDELFPVAETRDVARGLLSGVAWPDCPWVFEYLLARISRIAAGRREWLYVDLYAYVLGEKDVISYIGRRAAEWSDRPGWTVFVSPRSTRESRGARDEAERREGSRGVHKARSERRNRWVGSSAHEEDAEHRDAPGYLMELPTHPSAGHASRVVPLCNPREYDRISEGRGRSTILFA